METPVTFEKASKKTQREIAELMVSDKYNSSRPEDFKLTPEQKSESKSGFSDVSDKTQKEISRLVLKDNYISQTNKNSLSNAPNEFSQLRIMAIERFLAEQREKMKHVFESSEREFKQQERQITDEKMLKFTLGKKESADIEAKTLEFQKEKFEEIKGFEKDLMKKIRDNEQKYMKLQEEDKLTLLKAFAEGNYNIKMYE